MRFSKLLSQAGITPKHCRGDAEIADVQTDSRKCGAGSCFVAIDGVDVDGHTFIPDAIAAGAVAVVCEKCSNVPKSLACATVDNPRAAVGPLAQARLGWPGRKLTVIGITGTNGKTTVAYLTRAILAELGVQAGMTGTIRYETGLSSQNAGVTTPDAVSLAEMTAEMVAAGQTHLVMEVSSHALDQRRTDGLDFSAAVFTNLTGDHLDYHETMENYLSAKLQLFEQLDSDAHAIINRDDPCGGDAVAGATSAEVMWYGLSSAADMYARILHTDALGTQFEIIRDGQKVQVASSLIGRHNVMNCLAAAGACCSLGIDLPEIAQALSKVQHVPGRLQRVDFDAPYDVFVDYAHTDDALGNVLSALRPVTKGKLIVVFGCGGDRDRTKRQRMATMAERFADRVVVTSDNPRSEKPMSIIQEILAGFSVIARQEASVQPDRQAAIELAISQARQGDVILIAGKGHECEQIIGDSRVHFNDIEIAAAAMQTAEVTQ